MSAFAAAVAAIVGLIGTISILAVMVQARKLLPKQKFPPFKSVRLRNAAVGVAVLAGLAFLVFIVELMTLFNTPTEKVHHSTYVILLISLGAMLALTVVANYVLQRGIRMDEPRYTIRGQEIPPRQ